MALPSLVTWMCQKLLKRDFYTRKLGHHTTLVLRYGGTSPMIWKVISGHSDAFFMNQLHWNLLLEQMIWLVSTEKFSEEFTLKSLITFLKICQTWSNIWFKFKLLWDLIVMKSWRCLLFVKWVKDCSKIFTMTLIPHSKISCLAQSECLRICCIWRTDYQSHHMIQIQQET